MSADFDVLYAPLGRESIPPERLLRALLLQALYSIRSERQIVERIEFDLLFRWFVGLGIDDPVWNAITFTKKRDRLLAGDIAVKFLATVLAHPKVKLMASRNGLIVDALATRASGHAERVAAQEMIGPYAERPQAVTLGGDKGFDTQGFIAELREINVTPHVAQNTNSRRSAIDGRSTCHEGYQVSLRSRKRIEEAFGWAKTVAGLRKLRHRGQPKVDWQFTFAMAAYNLARLPKLLGAPAWRPDESKSNHQGPKRQQTDPPQWK